PALACVGGAEYRSVLNSGVNGFWIGERGFEMPDALELPRMLGPVVELMGGERFARFLGVVIDKLVALALRRSAGPGCRFARRSARLNPSLAAIIGALNDLPKP